MPWHRVRLSINDITRGKHIRLQRLFETLFLGRGEPPGAAMFVNGDPKDDYTYSFSPPCAIFFMVVLVWFGASACAPPVPKSVVWLSGDVGARDYVQRS